MTQDDGRICGAILAGGGSTRMGRPKQDLPLANGRTMIEHVHDALVAMCDDIVILGESAALSDVPQIADHRPQCGPLGGVEALLAAGRAGQYLVVPCDMPRITTGVLNALLSHTDHMATMYADHPLPARISRDALPAVTRLLDEGQRAVYALMDALGAARLDVDVDATDALVNINDPSDLAIVRRQ